MTYLRLFTHRFGFLLLLVMGPAFGCVSAPSASPPEGPPIMARPDEAELSVPPLPEEDKRGQASFRSELTASHSQLGLLATEVGAPPADKGEAAEQEEPATQPIDLANALGLGGAVSWQIKLAREKVVQAESELAAAKASWLPSLRFGVGWNKHDGRLQETEGNVLEIGRNSLFVGGGLGLGDASLAGGASGPSRLVVNLSLADAVFQPRVAQCLLAAEQARENQVFNDTLLEIVNAYYDLLMAQGQIANGNLALQASRLMEERLRDFERGGVASRSDVARAEASSAALERELMEAQRKRMLAESELTRLLQLPSASHLAPAEDRIAPIEIFADDMSLDQLLAQGEQSRPELAHMLALSSAAARRLRQETLRPWLPAVQVGASGGTFGGGPSAQFENQAGRSDVDVLAVWEWKNLGYGNLALQDQAASQLRQRRLQRQALRDQVAQEVTAAVADVRSYQRQYERMAEAAASARRAYQLDQQRLLREGSNPLELHQSIQAWWRALDGYTQSVIEHNKAQFRLLRAVGRPPETPHAPTSPT